MDGVSFYINNRLCPSCCAPELAGAQAHQPPSYFPKCQQCVQAQGSSVSCNAAGLALFVCRMVGTIAWSTERTCTPTFPSRERTRAPTFQGMAGCTRWDHHVLHTQALNPSPWCLLPASHHQYPWDYPWSITDLNTLVWT